MERTCSTLRRCWTAGSDGQAQSGNGSVGRDVGGRAECEEALQHYEALLDQQ